MFNVPAKYQRGFTLIELLAVMAIVAVLAGIVAVAVGGTGETSKDTQAQQDATTVETAASDFFADQEGAEVLTPFSATVLDQGPFQQIKSSRWPEEYISVAYDNVFPETTTTTVFSVTFLTETGTVSSLTFEELLTKYNAIDINRLFDSGFLSQIPEAGLQLTEERYSNYLWLLQKTTASGGSSEGAARQITVFKLVSVQENESDQLVDLTYLLLVGQSPEEGTPGPTATPEPTPTIEPTITLPPDLKVGIATNAAGTCPGPDFNTIGEALAVASFGTEIDVCPGVYSEALAIDSAGISLIGAPGAILDGSGLGSVNAITLGVGADGLVIDGFEIRNYGNQGVRGEGTLANRITNLTLNNLNIHDVNDHAIDITHGSGVEVSNSTIVKPPFIAFSSFGAPFWWAEGIRLQSVEGVLVSNTDVDGGFIGVNFACSGPCDGPEPPTNGVVTGSTFAHNFIGALVANSSDATIVGNEVSGVHRGIRVGFAGNAAQVSGTIVEGNTVHDNNHGILVWAGVEPPSADPGEATASAPTSGIQVINNNVLGNDTDGIVLVNTDDSIISGNTAAANGGNGLALLFGSTGNQVALNTAFGNDGAGTPLFATRGTADGFHDASSTPNTWLNNSFGTSSGDDIGF